jgi:hypothetical protein
VKESILHEAEKRLGLRLKKTRAFIIVDEAVKPPNHLSEPTASSSCKPATSKIVAEAEAEPDEPPGTLLSILGNVGELAPSVGKKDAANHTPDDPQPQPDESISLFDLWNATQ